MFQQSNLEVEVAQGWSSQGCTGLNSAPHKSYVYLELQNVFSLGNRIFADASSLSTILCVSAHP